MASIAIETKEEDPEEADRLERVEQKPLLSQCYNLMDFEAVARRVMKRTAWGYYSSAADDEIVRVTPSPPLWLALRTPCLAQFELAKPHDR